MREAPKSLRCGPAHRRCSGFSPWAVELALSSSSVVCVVIGGKPGVRKRTLHCDLGLANAASATVEGLSEVSAPPVLSRRQGDKAVSLIREHLRRRPDGIAVAFR